MVALILLSWFARFVVFIIEVMVRLAVWILEAFLLLVQYIIDTISEGKRSNGVEEDQEDGGAFYSNRR